MLTELLKISNQPDDPNHQVLVEMAAACEAATLTRQLLAFGRQSTGRHLALDLNAVIYDNATLLRRLLGQKIEVITVLPPNPLTVLADQGQLEQLLVKTAIRGRDGAFYPQV